MLGLQRCGILVAADQLADMTGDEMMISRILAMVAAVACSVGGMAMSATNLKPIEPLTLQNTVETTAKELLLPGAICTPRRAILLLATA